MFNRASSRNPIASFALPPHAPPAAAKAIENFEMVANAWAAIKGEITDANEARELAKAEAKAAAVQAAKDGKPVKINLVAIEQKFDTQIAELEAKEQALRVAVDEVGNDLALAIATNRGEWLARAEEAEASAATRYANAIKEAQAALNDLGPARGSVRWLSEFQANRARHGLEGQFAGGRVTIRHRLPGTVQSEWDPKVLLKAAAEVVEPTPKPQLATSRASK